jgi:TonB family protein
MFVHEVPVRLVRIMRRSLLCLFLPIIVLVTIPPAYPQDAKAARIQGVVVLRALIGRDGRVHDLSVIDGPSPSLIGAAMWAVSQWEYRPYILNGTPVEEFAPQHDHVSDKMDETERMGTVHFDTSCSHADSDLPELKHASSF